jgi:hypothetical protein
MIRRPWLPSTLLLWTACAVASPLVDDQRIPTGVGAVDCNVPPACQPMAWESHRLPAPEPLDLERCADEAQCAPSGTSTGSGAQAATACGGDHAQGLPQVASCSRELLAVSPEASELAYDHASWSRFEVVIEAHAPVTITLRSPELRAVSIALEGPVTLRLEDARAEDLRVQGAANARGAPELVVSGLEGKLVRFGDEDLTFDGAVQMRAAELEQLELYVHELTAESIRLKHGVVQAGTFYATDATFDEIELGSEHAVLAEFETHHCRLQLCTYATLIAGKLDRSIISACSGSVPRLYSSSITSGELEGQYESDDSDFENTLMGVTEDSEVLSFQSRFSSDALCSGLRLLALDAASLIKCSECDPSFARGERACELPSPPDVPSPVQANYCSVLPARRHLVRCDPDLPERSRKR